MQRLAENLPAGKVRVLTLGQPGDEAFDRESRVDVRRVASAESDRRLAMLRLNTAALGEARAFRPQVVLSGHIVASLGAVMIRRLLKVPFVQYVHADEFRGRARLSRFAVRAADRTIAVSEYTREMTLVAGAEAERIRVIHPGVDLPSISVEGERTEPVVLTVARIQVPYKGHDVIARALPAIRAKVPAARWVVIGDGAHKGEIEALVEAEGVADAVDFLGRVSDAERDSWLDRARIFCMPSRIPEAGFGGEGFGIVYQEAGAHGLPSVAGDVAGARDAVIAGETGLLVDPADPVAVGNAISELLGDPTRAREMGIAARRYAEEHAWPKIAARVAVLLREVATP